MIGWREFVHGIYWRFMPDYAGENALDAEFAGPSILLDRRDRMRCFAEAIGHTVAMPTRTISSG